MERKWILIIAVLVVAFLALFALRVFIYGPGAPYLPGYAPGYNRYAPMGPGMMYGPGYSSVGCPGMETYSPGLRPISESDALRRVEDFASRYGANVRVEDFLIFSNNYYAGLVDAGSGAGLAEVLVDRYSGDTYLEPGPNMMWNLRYGGGVLGEQRYDRAAAEGLAADFLADYLPGSRVMISKAFPGYYTFDFGRNRTEGMLSVNAYSGEIWVHTWHGLYLGGNESRAVI